MCVTVTSAVLGIQMVAQDYDFTSRTPFTEEDIASLFPIVKHTHFRVSAQWFVSHLPMTPIYTDPMLQSTECAILFELAQSKFSSGTLQYTHHTSQYTIHPIFTPHNTPYTHHTSQYTIHPSSLLTHHTVHHTLILTPHSSLITIHSSSLLTPHSSHSTPYTHPHSSLITIHSGSYFTSGVHSTGSFSTAHDLYMEALQMFIQIYGPLNINVANCYRYVYASITYTVQCIL